MAHPNHGARRYVIVPVGDINVPMLKTLEYARSLSDRINAVHVSFDHDGSADLTRRWEAAAPDVPLTVIESPSGSFVAPMLLFLDGLSRDDPDAEILIAIPQLITTHIWERPLHNQNATRLKKALARRPRTFIVEVPYRLS